MKVTGIIVEYNPFHYGHLHHIEEARRLTEPDVLVAVISGNYCQRGDLSVMDKFAKTRAALSHGVDLVIEIPFLNTVQNAYVFGKTAVDLLDQIGADHIVFGSETNNLEELKQYADLEVDVTRLKELMREGDSYPKAYGLLSSALFPNDILAVTYLKAMKDTAIIPVSIPRTNDYHSLELRDIASAAAIRSALMKGEDVSRFTPCDIEDPVFLKDLYPYIRNILITTPSEELSEIFLMSEGIENLLKKNAETHADFEKFMTYSVSRRYTRSRIQRILLMTAGHIRKKDVPKDAETYLRVLGFNEKGRELLRNKKEDVSILTQFKTLPEDVKEIEWKMTLLYASLHKDPETIVKEELRGPLIV